MFLLAREISLVDPSPLAGLSTGVRRRPDKVVFSSGPARAVILIAGPLYHHYGGGRGWDASEFTKKVIFSINTTDGSIINRTYIKAQEDAVMFHDFQGNSFALNTEDSQFDVFSPDWDDPERLYTVQFGTKKGEAKSHRCWGWALGRSDNASVVMAINKSTVGQQENHHVLEMTDYGRNFWRLRAGGGVKFAKDEEKWSEVLYYFSSEKIEPERARQMFMKLNSPLL